MTHNTLHKTKLRAGTMRIIDRRDYIAVANTGRKWVTSSFVLQMRRGEDCNEPVAIGFTTSRKVGNAVMRNKARRRLKEAARLALTGDDYKGCQFILIARAAATNYPFEKMQKDMRWASGKLLEGADLKASKGTKS